VEVGSPIALALGATLLGLPPLIHILTRPRPRALPFSAVRFLSEVLRQRRRWSRLRDFLVLALRLLAVALLVGAFARLFTPASSAVQWTGSEPTVRIVLLDVSQSLAARRSGVRVFDRARAAAGRYLAYRPGLRANVILAGAQAQPLFERLTENVVGLEQALSSTEPQSEELDLRAAFSSAARLFAQDPDASQARHELVVVTDLQRSNWQEPPFQLLPEELTVRFDQVGLTGTVGNLAVTDVQPLPSAGVAPPLSACPTGSPYTGFSRAGSAYSRDRRSLAELRIQVGNFADTSERARLEVATGNHLYSEEVVVPPWQTETVRLQVDTGGRDWTSGWVRLVGARDALPDDDKRPFVFHQAGAPTFCLLTRGASPRLGSSAYFLQRALCPQRDSSLRPMSAAELARAGRAGEDPFAGVDLICVVEPGPLAREAAAALASVLAAGTPVLYVACEPADAENLAALSQAAPTGKELQLPVRFVPTHGAPGRPEGSSGRASALRWQGPGRRVFGALGEGLAQLEKGRAFTSGLTSEPVAPNGSDGRTLGSQVLAEYEDGTAALVLGTCGKGRMAVLNLSLAGSDLPRSPLFVPLTHELVSELLRGRSAGATAVACGSRLTLPLSTSLPGGRPASQVPLRIVGPEQTAGDLGAVEPGPAGVVWRWDRVGEPGIYQVVTAGGEEAEAGGQTVHQLATACPASESDLRSLDPEGLLRQAQEREGWGEGARLEVERSAGSLAAGSQRWEWWPWLLLGCCGCLWAELLVLKVFRT